MKNSFKMIITAALCSGCAVAFAQNNNTNATGAQPVNPTTNQSNPATNQVSPASNTVNPANNQVNPATNQVNPNNNTITTRPVDHALPASGGTEPNNRVMLRSQTDSMDSQTRTSRPGAPLRDSTATERNRARHTTTNTSAPSYPAISRGDSLK
jgi:hypothetical protein